MDAKKKRGGEPVVPKRKQHAEPKERSFKPEDNLGLAKWMAASYAKYVGVLKHGMPVEDTEEYGDAMIGLIVASERFKPELGYKYSTYAQWWIRRFVREGQVQRGTLVRERRKVRNQEVLFTDFIVPGDDDIAPFENVLAIDGATHDPESETPMRRIWLLLERLDDRWRRIVFKRFILGMTLSQVGNHERPPITRECVRQIEGTALDKLRERCAGRQTGEWQLSNWPKRRFLRAAEYLSFAGPTRADLLGLEIDVDRPTLFEMLRHRWFVLRNGVADVTLHGKRMVQL